MANEETKDSVGGTDDLHGIYSDKLYGDDSSYTYYFSVNLLCSCSSNQMSDGFAKAILQFIESSLQSGSIQSENLLTYAEDVVQRLGSIREELFTECIRIFNIEPQK